MTIKHIFIITLAVSSLALFGCNEKSQKELEVVEHATVPTPVLTSTAPTPEPAEVDAPKAVAETKEPEVVEASKVLPKPETTPFVPVDGLVIRRFVTASEIAEREPVAAGSTFGPNEERIYAFVDASNESTSDKSLMVHFIGPNGEVSGGVELVIPASVPRWRTWAYTRHAKEPGLWRVEIRDVDGNLVGALPFEVEARI